MYTDSDVAGRDVVDERRAGASPRRSSFGLGTPTRVTALYSHLDQDNLPDYGIPWVPAATTDPWLAHAGARPARGVEQLLRAHGARLREDRDGRRAPLTAEHDFRPTLTLRNQLRYGRNDRDSVITAPRFVNASSPTQYTPINRALQSRDMTDTILSNQTSLATRFATGRVAHALVTGLDLGREESKNRIRTGAGRPDGRPVRPQPRRPLSPARSTPTGAVDDGRATTVGLYAFDTLHVGQKSRSQGGLRWDHFDLDFESRAADGRRHSLRAARTSSSAGAAGVVYKPRPNGSVYAGLGTSFNPSAEGLSLAPRQREPRSGEDAQLRGRQQVGPRCGGRLSLTGALFRTEKTNARTPGVNPGDPPQVLAGRAAGGRVELGAYGGLAQPRDALRRLRSHEQRDRGLEHRGRSGQRARPDPREHVQPLARPSGCRASSRSAAACSTWTPSTGTPRTRCRCRATGW